MSLTFTLAVSGALDDCQKCQSNSEDKEQEPSAHRWRLVCQLRMHAAGFIDRLPWSSSREAYDKSERNIQRQRRERITLSTMTGCLVSLFR
jgi:hypothetical protein